MERTPDERLAQLEGMAVMHGMVLRYLIEKAWPNEAQRGVTREVIVAALTRLYGATEPSDRAHDLFRAAVGEAEALFQIQSKGPKPDPT